MKRLTTASLAVVAAFALSACKGGGGAATKFIPDGAAFAVGINLSSLAKEDIFKDVKGMAEGKDEMKIAESAKACNIDVWGLDSVVVAGSDPDKEGEMAVVVAGSGVGSEANIKCLIEKATEKGAPEGMAKLEGKVLTLGGGEATAYLADDNTLVIAGKDWSGKVKELVDGGGKSASDGSLKDALGNVDAGKHIWVAGNVPEKMAKEMQGAKSGWATMDFSGGGLALEGQAKFDSADTAKKLAEEAEKAKGNPEAAKMMPKTAESSKVEADGDTIKVSVKMPKEEFNAVKGMAMMGLGSM